MGASARGAPARVFLPAVVEAVPKAVAGGVRREPISVAGVGADAQVRSVLHRRGAVPGDGAVVVGEGARPRGDPLVALGGHRHALLHQAALPRSGGGAPQARPQRGVPLGQRPAVLLEGLHVPGPVQRQHHVEEAPPPAGPAADQAGVRRGEGHRAQPSQGVGDPGRFASVHGHLLPLPFPVEPRRHGGRPLAVDLAPQVEHVFGERHELTVAGSSERPKALQIVDRLQQVGLPLGVVSDDGHALRGEVQLLDSQVPKAAQFQVPQDHDDGRTRRASDIVEYNGERSPACGRGSSGVGAAESPARTRRNPGPSRLPTAL